MNETLLALLALLTLPLACALVVALARAAAWCADRLSHRDEDNDR